MSDALVARCAAEQFNRISWAQLMAAGLSARAIEHRVSTGRLVLTDAGVYAVDPVLDHDPWGRWMGAVLTHPDTLEREVFVGHGGAKMAERAA